MILSKRISILHCVIIHDTVLEIKVWFSAHAGCTGSQNCAPGSLSVCSPLYKGINMLENACTHRVHRFENLCTRQPKCVHRVQGAPLISNTDDIYIRDFNLLQVPLALERH